MASSSNLLINIIIPHRPNSATNIVLVRSQISLARTRTIDDDGGRFDSNLLLRQPLLKRRGAGGACQLEDFDLGMQARNLQVDDMNVRRLHPRFAGQRVHFEVIDPRAPSGGACLTVISLWHHRPVEWSQGAP